MIKLYSFWRSLATYRVRIALNLKGIVPDEVVDVNLIKGHQHHPAYRIVNPMMALPSLIDGDGPILFESLAIIEYLDETHPDPPLLPKDPRGRARARALAQIVACDSHPLVVPRIREYLEHQLNVGEAARMDWCRHWIAAALGGIEAHLREPQTGVFCHGDEVTVADICLASQGASARFFGVDMGPYPNVSRIVHTCLDMDAFARAHPLRQPGAPAA
jgi:maleylacetoacetate isomerase